MPRPGSSGVVTDRFGPRQSPGGIGSSNHLGEDTAPPGNVAPVTGEICYADYNSGWGYIYGIQERANPSVVWFVAHNANLAGVRVGAQVTEGDYIAPCGSTGNSTGPHAHTERRVGGTVYPGTGVATDPRPYYTSSAGGGATPLPEDEDMNTLTRIIFDQGPASAPGFASTAVLNPFAGFVKTSDGAGKRDALEGYSAIAGVLGMKIIESHVDANGWALAQLFKPVTGGVRLDEAAWAKAVEATLLDDFARINATITSERVALEGKITAKLNTLQLPGFTEAQIDAFVQQLDFPTAAEIATATNMDAAERLQRK